MTTSHKERRIARLEKRWIELDREIFEINKLVACIRLPFSRYPRWAEAYSEIEQVERELAELRKEQS